MNLRKKILLTLLCMVMVFTMMPTAGAYADQLNPTTDETYAALNGIFGYFFDFDASNGLNSSDRKIIYDYVFNNTYEKNTFNGLKYEQAQNYCKALQKKDQYKVMATALEMYYSEQMKSDDPLLNLTEDEISKLSDADRAKYDAAVAEEETRIKPYKEELTKAIARLDASQQSVTDKKEKAIQDEINEKAEIANRYKNPEPTSYQSYANTYALVVRHGATTPVVNSIREFVVSYVDTSGIIRKEYIRPEESFKVSQEQAANAASVAAASDDAEQKAAKEVADAMSFSNQLGGKDNPYTAYNTETFMFTTQRAISKFEGVSFLTAKDNERFEWDIQEMSLIAVEKVYGLENVGYFCDQPYINLSGSTYMTGTYIRAANGTGETVGVSEKTTSYIHLKHSNSNTQYALCDVANPTAEENKVRTYERTKTYYMNISIKDLPNAGIEAYNTDLSTGSLALCESLYAEIHYVDINKKSRTVYYPVIANAMAFYLENVYRSSSGEGTDISSAISFAQQNENIAFKMDIPDCLSIDYITFMYANQSNAYTTYFEKLVTSPSASTKLADTFIKDNEDRLNIAGIQFWDWQDVVDSDTNTLKAYMVPNETNPNINPSIYGDCTYFYKTTATNGLEVNPNEGFTFTVPSAVTLSTDDANDFISNQLKSSKFLVYDLAGETYDYKEEAEAADAAGSMSGVQLLAPSSGLSGDGWYAMKITTSPQKLASTAAGAYMQIEYVSNKNDEVKKTAAYNLSSIANSYYGYWAGAEVKNLSTTNVSSGYTPFDSSYRYGVAGGQTFTVLFQIKDLASEYTSWKNLYLSLDGSVNDDWQIEGFEIYKVDSLQQRTVEKIDKANYNKVVMNRVYSRDFNGEVRYKSALAVPILIQRGATVTVNMDNTAENEIESVKDRGELTPDLQSLSLEQAKGDMGFTEEIKSYTVNVKVASSGKADAKNNDGCGSDNYFYFQLNFESGYNTGFVLANQQLTSDGFRAGETESFVISTNMDYGNLASITILPDATYENADPDDKLCIEEVSVIRSTNTGIKHQWVVNNIGWISVQFEDSGSDSETKKESGHLLGQIAKAYSIAYENLIVSVEFEMSIGAEQLAADGTSFGQYIGDLQATIEYDTSTGGISTLSGVQIVKKMYEYDGFIARVDDDTMQYYSDEDMMFRSGTVDRFIVDIPDFRGLKSMTLYASSDEPRCLTINCINASIITSKGTLYINKCNEYQMSYKVPLAYLASSTEAVTLKTSGSLNGIWQKMNKIVKFTENEISNVVDADEGMNIVSKTPASKNDKLNVFWYLDLAQNSVPNVKYQITCYVGYTTTDGKSLENDKVMTYNSSTNCFYIIGMDVSKYKSISSIKFTTNGIGAENKCVIKDSQAYIQRTRNGVLVETATAKFMSSGMLDLSVADGNSIEAAGSSQIVQDVVGSNTQTVRIQLASSCPEVELAAETQDVAVAIRYTTARDKSGSTNLYMSQYVYATESGATKIGPGEVLEFTFNENDIEAISDIVIMPTGGLKVYTEKAYCICNGYLNNSTTTKGMTNYYSFANGTKAALGGGRMYYTNVSDTSVTGYLGEGSVREVNIDITSGTSESGSTGIEAADAEITFEASGKQTDSTGALKKLTITNIQDYIVGGKTFNAGETQTVKLFIKDYGKIRNIKLIPRTKDSGDITGYGVWKVDKIVVSTCTYQTTGSPTAVTNTITPNQTIYETDGGYSFNMANIIVALKVEYGASTGEGVTETIQSGTYSMILDPGKKVTITPTVSGSLYAENSVNINVVEIVGDSTTPVDKSVCLKTTTEKAEFTAPANTTGQTRTYLITFKSQECDSVQTAVKVSVPSGNISTPSDSIIEGDEIDD